MGREAREDIQEESELRLILKKNNKKKKIYFLFLFAYSQSNPI